MDTTKTIVIPARLASTRLPRKLLLDVHGKPLIWHTVQRALESRLAFQIIVATEDDEIAVVVDRFRIDKVKVIKTPPMESGTSRVAWLVKQTFGAGHIVNLQGDEPLLPGAAIDMMFDALEWQSEVVTLSTNIDVREFHDPDVVKVVTNRKGHALYFSRSPIPNQGSQWAKKHIGIYGYNKVFFERLARFTEPGFLAMAEKLEQLSWLEHGTTIKVIHQPGVDSLGIDSDDDYQELLRRLSPKTEANPGAS